MQIELQCPRVVCGETFLTDHEFGRQECPKCHRIFFTWLAYGHDVVSYDAPLEPPKNLTKARRLQRPMIFGRPR